MKQNLILGGITLLLMGLGIAGCILAVQMHSGTTAVITQNGHEIYRIDLSAVEESYTIVLHGDNSAENTILVEQNAISMQSASCPDGLCTARGKITGSGLPIVCLPNHIMIEIEGDEDDRSEIDVQVY